MSYISIVYILTLYTHTHREVYVNISIIVILNLLVNYSEGHLWYF